MIAKRGGTVRAFVRRPEANGPLKQAGAAEIAVGDLMDHGLLRLAMTGAGTVLHICPPMHPEEDAIARTMIGLAGDLAVDRFILYSVLHPLLGDVPHHNRKLQAERALVNSGLNYTILAEPLHAASYDDLENCSGHWCAQHAVRHQGAL